MEKPDYGDILKKEKLKFKNTSDLRKYYEDKYAHDGYKKGFTLFGVNISNIYHKNRKQTSLDLLNPQKKDIILDVSCGDGSLTLRLANRCKKVYGVDISKNAFQKSKEIAPKNVIFRQGDIEHLNFKDKTFDKIVSIETLEHVLHPKQALKELYRVLKNKGKLILTYPTIDTTRVARFQKFIKIAKPFKVSEHLTERDYNEVIKEAESKGFKFVKARGIVYDLGKIEKLNRLSKKFMFSILKLQLSIKNHPKNSLFVAFEFEKI